MNFDERARKLGVLDMGLVKWSAVFFTLFVIGIWPAFAEWVLGVHWGWFLAGPVVLAANPTYTFFR